MNENVEKRTLYTRSVDTLNVRSTDRHISGYAVTWDAGSALMGGGKNKFRERVKPGAFKETLQNDDQFFFWSHDSSKVLGRKYSGTLRLHEDSIGLKFHLDLPDTTFGKDAYESIKRRDITGISIGFIVQNDKWDDGLSGISHRTVLKARLKEISAVSFPAYPDSDVVIGSPMEDEEESARQRLIDVLEREEQEQKAKIKLLTMV